MDPERAVTALVMDTGEDRRFVAPALLVWRGSTVVALAADLPGDARFDQLRVVVTRDGASVVRPQESWPTESGHVMLVLGRATWSGDLVPLPAGSLCQLREDTDANVVALGIIPQGRFRTVRIGVRLYAKHHRSASPRSDERESYHAIARDEIPEGTLRRGAPIIAVYASSPELCREAEVSTMGLACGSGAVVQVSLDRATRPDPALDPADDVPVRLTPPPPAAGSAEPSALEWPRRSSVRAAHAASDPFAWIARVLERVDDAAALIRWLGEARPGDPIVPLTWHIDDPRPLGPTSFMVGLYADDRLESITAVCAADAPTLADAVRAFGTARSLGRRSVFECYEMKHAQLPDARFELSVACVGAQPQCYMVTLRRRPRA